MNISRAMAAPSVKELETAFQKAKAEVEKEVDSSPSKVKAYENARNAYITKLKTEVKGKNNIDYLDKRIEILQYEKKKEEIFDSRLGKKDEKGIGSDLLEFAPFQETEQEGKEKGGDASKNVYDLFVKFPSATAASGGTTTPAKKQGVYEGILNKSKIDPSSDDESTFEELPKSSSKPPYSDNASFLSPFAIYKLWLPGEENSYTLLRTLLEFLGEGEENTGNGLKRLDAILIEQFDKYDAKKPPKKTDVETPRPEGAIGQSPDGRWYYASSPTKDGIKYAYDLVSLQGFVEPPSAGAKFITKKDGIKYLVHYGKEKSGYIYIFNRNGDKKYIKLSPSMGGGRRTPRRHLKREGRKTKKLPRASP